MQFLTSLGIQPIVLLAMIINLAILFFAFKYFIWDKLQKSIEERRELMKKLEDADAEYERIIADANSQADEIFAQAEKEKQTLIDEWHAIGKKKQEQIISEANNEAEVVINQAKQKAEKLWKTLEDDFESSVKHTAMIAVRKLFDKKDTWLQAKYIDEVLKEVQK